MSWVDDIVKLGNLGVNAYDSFATQKLRAAEKLDDERKQKSLILFRDEIADENRDAAFIDSRLLDVEKENKAEMIRLDKKAKELDFDYENYIGSVPENERTESMKAVFEDEADYGNYQLFKIAEHSDDVNQLRSNVKATNDLNTWKIKKLSSEIEKFEQGKAESKKLQDVAGIQSILDYHDYTAGLNEFKDKYLVDEETIQQFQETYMGMTAGDAGFGMFGPKTTAQWESIMGTPTATVGTGPDEKFGTADDDVEALTARGAGFMSGAPTTKEQLNLENALSTLKNKKAARVKASKKDKLVDIDWDAKKDEWWDENANQPLRNQAVAIKALKEAVKVNDSTYFEYMTYDASEKFDKEGGFRNLEDVESFRENLGISLLNAVKWGAPNYYEAKKTTGKNDFNTMLTDMFNDLVPNNNDNIHLGSGMHKDYEGKFDFNQWGMGENEAAKKHFVQNLIMWKQARNVENEWTGGNVEGFGGKQGDFLRLQLMNQQKVDELSGTFVPSYTAEDYTASDLLLLNNLVPGIDNVYDENTNTIDNELLQTALDKLELINTGQ